MDVILHIGAHRTATKTMAEYFTAHQMEAQEQGLAFWGSDKKRRGLFAGLCASKNSIMPDTPRQRDRAVQRINMELDRLEKSGVQQLIVSEPAMIGSMMQNVQQGRLYPNAQPRLERFFDAFGARCQQIAFSVRSYESYWESALSYAIPRGFSAPSEDDIDRLVTQPRRWKTVITEGIKAFPQAEAVVWPFEALAGHPDRQLALMTGAVFENKRETRPRSNTSRPREAILKELQERDAPQPERWPPFSPHHSESFRAQYHDDLKWLKSGEIPKITYSETVGKHRHFKDLTDSQDVAETPSAYQRGHPNDREERRMV